MSTMDVYQIMSVLFLLLAGHALADYPLQGDWLSRAKNHTLEPVSGEVVWPLALISHALIHALMVYIATWSLGIACAELVAHTVIDYSKCDGRLSYNQDQIFHILCKLVYTASYLKT